MTWLKVDDQFTDHPKVLALGKDRLAGIGLWTIGSCYAARFLTDGYIPATALPAGSRRLAMRLVQVGLWDVEADGYRIHDYLNYQPGRETVLTERKRNADRQSRHRHTATNGASNGVTNGVSTGAPSRPVPIGDEPPNPPDDLELLTDDLLAPNVSTPRQLRAVTGFARLLGRERTLTVLAEWRSRLDVEDRFTGAFEQLQAEAAESKEGKRKPSEFAYMDEESGRPAA